MAGGSSEDNPVGINVTAMVDIIFCLCLFFMCSLKFRDLDGRLDSWLPKEVGPNPSSAPPRILDEMRVLLSWNGERQVIERLFGNRPVPSGVEGDRQLQRLVAEQNEGFRRLGKADVPLIIDSGRAVPWREVVKVMNLAREVHVAKVEFAMGSAQLDEGG
jgi:biopolymer transport protein ExbD